MRKRTLGVVLLAGLAMSGAGAFTGSNDMTAAATNTAGYGSVTATGVTVTDVDFASVALDESKLDSVTFYTDDDLTGKVARMTLRLANGNQVEGYDCTETYYGVGAVGPLSVVPVALGGEYSTAVCSVAGDRGYAEFEGVGLTVLDA